METHWKNVIPLLTGRNAACKVASSVLSEIVTFDDLPDVLHELLTTYAINASLTTRSCTAQAVKSIVSKFSAELIALLAAATSDGEIMTLDDIDVTALSTTCPGLYNTSPFTTSEAIYDRGWISTQKRRLKRRLGLETVTSAGALAEKYVADDFIVATDVLPDTSTAKSATSGARAPSVWSVSNENWFTRLLRVLSVGLMHDSWQTRHGSCMCLSSLFAALQLSTTTIPSFIVEDVLALGMCVLILEKFMDFGEYVTISPVKEVAAQLIANASSHCNHIRLATLIAKAVDLTENSTDNIRVSGLLLMKYILPLHHDTITADHWTCIISVMIRSIRSYNIELSDAGAKLCQSVCYCFIRVPENSVLRTIWPLLEFMGSLKTLCATCSTVNEGVLVLVMVLRACTSTATQCYVNATDIVTLSEAALQCVVILMKKLKFAGRKLRATTLSILTEVLKQLNTTAAPSSQLLYHSSACVGSLISLILSSPGVDISGLHLETRVERDQSKKKTIDPEQDIDQPNYHNDDEAVNLDEHSIYEDFIITSITLYRTWLRCYGINSIVSIKMILMFLFQQYLNPDCSVAVPSATAVSDDKPSTKRRKSVKSAKPATSQIVIGEVLLPSVINVYSYHDTPRDINSVVTHALATGLAHVFTEEGSDVVDFNDVSMSKLRPMGDVRLSRFCLIISTLTQSNSCDTLQQFLHAVYDQKFSYLQSLQLHIDPDTTDLMFVLRDDVTEMYTPRYSTHHSALPSTMLKACYTLEQLQWILMFSICLSQNRMTCQLPEAAFDNSTLQPLLSHLNLLYHINVAMQSQDITRVMDHCDKLDGYAELAVSIGVARMIQQQLASLTAICDVITVLLPQLSVSTKRRQFLIPSILTICDKNIDALFHHCIGLMNSRSGHPYDVLYALAFVTEKHKNKCQSYIKSHFSQLFSWILSVPIDGDAATTLAKLCIVCDDDQFVLSHFTEAVDKDAGVSSVAEVFQQYVGILAEKVLQNFELHIGVALRGIGHYCPTVRKMFSHTFRSLVPLAAVYRSKRSVGCEISNILIPFADQHFSGGIDVTADVMKQLTTYANLSFTNAEMHYLRRYQQDGISWLLRLWRSGLSGVLADDMGLGKTLQTLMCIGIRKLENLSRNCPSLVVCPASLVMHWKREVVKFFSESLLHPIVLADTSCDDGFLSTLSSGNVAICSYAYLRRHIISISTVTWECVVLDEAHIIRNPHSEVAKCCFRLRGHSRVALTGTPLQNKVDDLWSLFNFVLPDYLGDFTYFQNHVIRPVLKSYRINDVISGTVTTIAANQVDVTAEALAILRNLHKQVLPFILRRTKEHALPELPTRTLVDVYCPLSNQQKRLYAEYQSNLSLSDEDLSAEVARIVNKENVVTKLNEGLHVFRALMLLRLLCVHPSLVFPTTEEHYRRKLLRETQSSGKVVQLVKLMKETSVVLDGEFDAEMMEELYADEVGDDCSSDSGESVNSENSICSGEKIMRPSTDTAPRKCLIFAQHRSVLDIVEECVMQRYFPSISYRRIDGNSPPAARANIAHDFNSDTSPSSVRLLLLTTGACGLGLNLTGAEMVIFMECNWNPFVDLQAMDRVHRLGQSKPVTVYKLLVTYIICVADSTIEARLVQLQNRKQFVAREVIIASDSGISTTNDDIWSSITANQHPMQTDRESMLANESLEDINLDSFLASFGKR